MNNVFIINPAALAAASEPFGERLIYSLQTTVLGLGMVFAVLALLWLVLLLSKVVFERIESRKSDDKTVAAPETVAPAPAAEPVVYARRNECCGGYVTMESPEFAKKKSMDIIENAKAAGAEVLVTACPLCRYNLQKAGTDMPVVYITELLAEALGVKEVTDEQ